MTTINGTGRVHTDALHALPTLRGKLRYACEHLPAGSSTDDVRAFLADRGVPTQRPYASTVVNEWRREHGLTATGEQPALTPETLAQLDAAANASANGSRRTQNASAPASTPVPAVESTVPDASDDRPPVHRAWLALLALPAFVAVWGGWVGLGGLAGFGPVKMLPGIADSVTLNLAVTLPAGMEAYAAIALAVWLSGRTRTERTRRFAMVSSLAALAIGCLGQILFHVLARPPTAAPVAVTVFVSCLPVMILGAGAALFHMIGDDQRRAHQRAGGAI